MCERFYHSIIVIDDFPFFYSSSPPQLVVGTEVFYSENWIFTKSQPSIACEKIFITPEILKMIFSLEVYEALWKTFSNAEIIMSLIYDIPVCINRITIYRKTFMNCWISQLM